VVDVHILCWLYLSSNAAAPPPSLLAFSDRLYPRDPKLQPQQILRVYSEGQAAQVPQHWKACHESNVALVTLANGSKACLDLPLVAAVCQVGVHCQYQLLTGSQESAC
jgi:hypothetical protein